MTTKRHIVVEPLSFRRPLYVPWAWKMTIQCAERMQGQLPGRSVVEFIDSHMLDIKSPVRRYEALGGGLFRDTYGVTWDRSVDADIGNPVDWPIREPGDLARYRFPDADEADLYAPIGPALAAGEGLFRRYCIGLSLYERAWTLRGMTQLLMDMVDRPEFVEDLLDAVAEHNLLQIRQALRFDFDGFHFGDDYGMQAGLIMGLDHWRRFVRPRLARMFAPIRAADKFVFLHSCGQVTELLDDLIEIGLNCLDPFQPEAMDTQGLLDAYRGRLAFHGGMSIQKVLPFGTPDEVRRETLRLLEQGRGGGFVFALSHAVPRDVPPENLRAMMEVLHAQAGYAANG